MDISPLFAVDAEELLEQGNVQEAIDLCLKGLEVYPGYPAGEAILARAYKISGDSDKANEILESAIEKNPFNKALNTLKKFDLEIENVEKIHREPRFKPAIKRKKKKKTSTEISPKETKIEEEEFSVNDFYDDLEINDSSDEIINETNENLIDDIKLDDNESDQSDLLDDFKDEDLLSSISSEEEQENNYNDFEDNIENFNLSDFNEDEISELDEFIENETIDTDDSVKDKNIDETIDDSDSYLSESFENDLYELEYEFNQENELEEETKGITIDFEDLELIPGLSQQEFRLNLKDVKSFELTNIIFDYNIQKFDSSYKIKLLKSFENLSLNELASKLNDAKIGKLKNDLPEPEIVDYNVEDIATETMAEIYYEQGAFDEAIKVYNKLIIKYPKKLDYFKNKINEVIEAKETDLNNIKTFNLGN